MKRRTMNGLIILFVLGLATCGTASRVTTEIRQTSNQSIMKVYSYDSSSSIGKTNTQDDEKMKKLKYTMPDIPGLNIQTVVLNMENSWGIKPVPSTFDTTNSYGYYGKIGNPYKGVQKTYNVSWLSPQKVFLVHFVVGSNRIGNGVSQSELKSTATQFLGYGATLPYSGADPKTAQQWVVHEIQTYTGKYTVGRKIGTIYFILTPNEKISSNEMVSELTITSTTYGLPADIFKI